VAKLLTPIEIYAAQRLVNSPLRVNEKKRESPYDRCTCTHGRAEHAVDGKCVFPMCFCSNFKVA
jgi:hypothetical protein